MAITPYGELYRVAFKEQFLVAAGPYKNLRLHRRDAYATI
jgi:hypothetical protein